MRVLNIGGICLSLGETIYFKYHLDLLKSQYDQIRLGFYKPLYFHEHFTQEETWAYNKQLWDKYLYDLGKLFFLESPYVLEENPHHFFGNTSDLIRKLGIALQKPNLSHLLCKGTSLNLGEEYIVITTKIREMDKKVFYPLSIQLWKLLNKLSEKYRIVVLGERVVEMRREYQGKSIFGIYEDIIANLPANRILDLTLPALGETVADLSQIQQDCLIMNQAKFVITLGIGGNVCMATASNSITIGFRGDNYHVADIAYGKEYPNCIITKNWNHFIQTIERHS